MDLTHPSNTAKKGQKMQGFHAASAAAGPPHPITKGGLFSSHRWQQQEPLVM